MRGLSIEARYLEDETPSELDQTYRDTFSRLKNLFRARGCTPEEAADLAQEAAMRAYVHVRRWGTAGEGLDPLINRIARNLLIDRHRRVAPHLVSLDNVVELPDPALDPTEEIIRRQQAGAVQSAVAELPARHRTAILASMTGLTPAEVADQLGIGRNAADALLHRARRSLRDRLRHINDVAMGAAFWMRIRTRNAVAKVPFNSFEVGFGGASAGLAASAAVFAAVNIFVPFQATAQPDMVHVRSVSATIVNSQPVVAVLPKNGSTEAVSEPQDELSGTLASGSLQHSQNQNGVRVRVTNPNKPSQGALDAAPEIVRQQNENALINDVQTCVPQAPNCKSFKEHP